MIFSTSTMRYSATMKDTAVVRSTRLPDNHEPAGVVRCPPLRNRDDRRQPACSCSRAASATANPATLRRSPKRDRNKAPRPLTSERNTRPLWVRASKRKEAAMIKWTFMAAPVLALALAAGSAQAGSKLGVGSDGAAPGATAAGKPSGDRAGGGGTSRSGRSCMQSERLRAG